MAGGQLAAPSIRDHRGPPWPSFYGQSSRQGAVLGTASSKLRRGAHWFSQGSVPPSVTSIHFTDNLTGWIASLGTLFRTIDGGANWVIQPGPGIPLYDVYFPDSQTGWVVGFGGTIVKYEAVSTPVAGFTWSVQGASVQLSNTSTDATSFFWDFGDGQTSDAENPQHIYADTGIYLVKLTVSNACGGTATQSSKTVSVTSRAFPALSFFAHLRRLPQSGGRPLLPCGWKAHAKNADGGPVRNH